jgi:hypothetical protein
MKNITLAETQTLPAGTYTVGVYASRGCAGCEGFIEKNPNLDYVIDMALEKDPINFVTYSFLPSYIPSVVTINK